ncbi:MAG TPA: SDR family oxidoreductase, partial [Gaiellaceae bacterium]|nr:SDR family oxidoreductase [Gaiellaceae bacterium]
MSRFAGKRALILGVANKRSIAWAIARRLADEGAGLAFTFQGERIEGNVRELAGSVGSPLVTPCDVRSDEDGVTSGDPEPRDAGQLRRRQLDGEPVQEQRVAPRHARLRNRPLQRRLG